MQNIYIHEQYVLKLLIGSYLSYRTIDDFKIKIHEIETCFVTQRSGFTNINFILIFVENCQIHSFLVWLRVVLIQWLLIGFETKNMYIVKKNSDSTSPLKINIFLSLKLIDALKADFVAIIIIYSCEN